MTRKLRLSTYCTMVITLRRVWDTCDRRYVDQIAMTNRTKYAPVPVSIAALMFKAAMNIPNSALKVENTTASIESS